MAQLWTPIVSPIESGVQKRASSTRESLAATAAADKAVTDTR